MFLHLLALFPHDFLTHSSGDIVEVRRSVFHNHWNGFSRHVRSAKKTTSTSTHRLLQRNSAKKHITITCLFCLFAPALAITHKNQKDNNNKSFGGAFSTIFFAKGSPTRHPSLGNEGSNIITHRIHVWYIYTYIHANVQNVFHGRHQQELRSRHDHETWFVEIIAAAYSFQCTSAVSGQTTIIPKPELREFGGGIPLQTTS